MLARILNVGDEVLSGKTVNTNASFLSLNLEKIGFDVEKVIVIADDEVSITREVEDFINSDALVLITTGGLGPTHDDITKEAICKALGLEMYENESARDLLNSYFDKSLLKANIKQTYFPKDAIIIENSNGTADGAIIENDGKIYIILVGPPFEMMPMFNNTVKPYLEKKINNKKISQEFNVMGNGESFFEEYLQGLYNKYPDIKIAPYAALGKIRYLIMNNKDNQDYLNRFDNAVSEFKTLMKDYIISEKDEEIEEVVVKLLKDQHLTISFAESITGGMLASKIVNVSGASLVLKESLITYSNEAKMKYLQVSKETIEKFGVVSSETAVEMVKGLKNLTLSDVAVSVTGVAGPATSENKEVGTIYFAISINNKVTVETKRFKGNREKVRTLSTLWILFRLSLLLKQKTIAING